MGIDEDIVVADTNNHRIQVFDKSGDFKYQFGIPGEISFLCPMHTKSLYLKAEILALSAVFMFTTLRIVLVGNVLRS